MVMHSRKPQRMNDGYFEKHQSHSYQSSKYNSKRDYERERSSNYRDRDISPVGSGGGSIGGALNNGTSSSYRSQSPEVDSPSSRGHISSHDIRDRGDHRGGGGGGGGGDRFSYIQKMRDRDRELYKKDKYLDKRDRRVADRDSESHRTNHDRIDRRGGAGSSSGVKICSSSGGGDNKRSGSDDRERERDRDRDRERDLRDKRERDNIRERERERDRERERERDRDRDRNNRADERERDRGSGGGNGSGERNERGERVARCGDWSEHVSSSGKMYYYNCKTEVSQWEKPKEWIDRERNVARDQHREKDYREKEREREERFSRSSYAKHSSSRGSSRVRWNYDNDGGPPNHRRRLDGRMPDNADMDISPGDSTPTSEANYSLTGTPTGYDVMGVGAGQPHNNDQTLPSPTVGLPNALPRLASHPNASVCGSLSSGAGVGPSMHYAASVASHCGGAGVVVGGATMLPATGLASTSNVLSNTAAASQHRKLDGVQTLHYQSHLIAVGSPNTTTASSSNQGDHSLNSNAPGPPAKVSSKDPALLMRQQSHHLNSSDGHILTSSQVNEINHHMVSQAGHHNLRENTLNATCHGMSPMSYTKSPMGTSSLGGGPAATHASNLVASCSGLNVGSSASISYSSAHSYGLKNVTDGSGSNNLVLNSISGNAMPSHMGATNHAAHASGSILPGEGPPTPTQELDISGNPTMDMQQQRKMDNTTSASLSNLQSCVSNSIQAGRCQGPEISTKLSKYFRADLITHVTNWAADHLEKQSQKCSEEAHLYGDIQCTKISAELKCARSLVRITEITATLQEQKIMYLRQQIHRLEESKSQNSFMSDDL